MVGVGVLVMLMPGTAHGQVASVTVTPSTGLTDGQTVTVSGTGFVQGPFLRILQCAGEPGDLSSAVSLCDLGPFVLPAVDAQGNVLPTPFTVSETISTSGLGLVNCRTSQCVILIGQLPGRFLFTPISFGAPTPTSTAQCKHGGWRNLANEQGRPFRTQGQCVSYVASPRRATPT
jgi:hypothetical protein